MKKIHPTFIVEKTKLDRYHYSTIYEVSRHSEDDKSIRIAVADLPSYDAAIRQCSRLNRAVKGPARYDASDVTSVVTDAE